jgi:hypothetical protein
VADPQREETRTTVAKRAIRVEQSNDSALDWHILRTAHPNVLMVGSAAVVEQSLTALMPHLGPPICFWTLDTSLPSPGDVKTLVIRHVDRLSAEQQRTLSGWLEQAAVTRTRVESTTTVPLFPRIATGLFSDALYYRLNTLMWQCGTEQALGPRRRSDSAHAPVADRSDHSSPPAQAHFENVRPAERASVPPPGREAVTSRSARTDGNTPKSSSSKGKSHNTPQMESGS